MDVAKKDTPSDDPVQFSHKDLFVGNLSLYSTAEDLKAYFAQYGEITDVRVLFHPITGKSRRFGFVTFASAASMESALKDGKHFLQGKYLETKHATKRGSKPLVRPKTIEEKTGASSTTPSIYAVAPPTGSSPADAAAWRKDRKVFVGGISQETTVEDLRNYFIQFVGGVENVILLVDSKTGRHRGFGFVTFRNPETANYVCQIRFHMIKQKRIECKMAEGRRTETVKKEPGEENAQLAAAAAAMYQQRFAPYSIPMAQPQVMVVSNNSGIYPIQALFSAAQTASNPFFGAPLFTNNDLSASYPKDPNNNSLASANLASTGLGSAGLASASLANASLANASLGSTVACPPFLFQPTNMDLQASWGGTNC